MSLTRRTTVTARVTSLAALEREAKRRGVSLAVLVAEAIDEKALALRRARRLTPAGDPAPTTRLDD